MTDLTWSTDLFDFLKDIPGNSDTGIPWVILQVCLSGVTLPLKKKMKVRSRSVRTSDDKHLDPASCHLITEKKLRDFQKVYERGCLLKVV